ncbi:MAG TPA: hypothetical protein VJX92_15480 [Methylomirabilota bacterium]|nr:hypothetical protein [Methylomirabilota bacterium]
MAAVALVVLAGLAPVSASADDGRDGMSPPPPGSTSRPTRPPFHRRPIFPCCVGFSYFPEPAPPVIVVPPPPVVYVVPSPPALTYVPTPRPEPAPEVVTPSGRWARHGNGKEYPYTWVWVGPAR